MKQINFLKNNAFFTLVIVIYLVSLFVSQSTFVAASQNSIFYFREMLMIMPIIFILTALLDAWVEKDVIAKYLGSESKLKGAFFSFLLGSVSAGPIYAAFPICVMLHKKGATVKNIVIILSSWAVIKIPMLVNEAKFLGFEFMIIRWILTIIAIFVMASIMSYLVKDKDLKQKNEMTTKGLIINKDACMGCKLCVKMQPELIDFRGRKAILKKGFETVLSQKEIEDLCIVCPVKAIEYIK